MKVLIVAAFLFGTASFAQDKMDDPTKGVLILSADTDRLTVAFASEKSCQGLHQVQWGGHSTEKFNWSMALVKNDFVLMTTGHDPDHYISLGSNPKKAVKRACSVIKGKEEATWMVLP